ncbi:hypothetical protein GCM10028805_07890 [Spirosoma harenae]
MTETELIDRLREAIVLDGPDVWRTNGYLQDAQRVGLSLADAQKRAAEIVQEVANNSLLFQNIQTRIARMAQPSRSHLREQDTAQIVNAATSLKLSADFVKNRWIPTELKRITPAPVPEPKPIESVVAPVEAPVKTPEKPADREPVVLPKAPEQPVDREPIVPKYEPVTAKPVVNEPVVPVSPPPVPVQSPTFSESSTYDEPQPIVRSFTATPARIRQGQTVTLEWEVDNLLAVTIDDLGEGLSPINRGWVKPSKSTDYTLFDANNNPLSTVRVDVIPRDRSGIYGVLFALILLAIIYWFIKSNNSSSPNREPDRNSKTEKSTGSLSTNSSKEVAINSPSSSEKEIEATEATDDTPVSTADSAIALTIPPKSIEKPAKKPTEESTASHSSETQSTTPSDARQGKYEQAFGGKPYDKVELGTDEQGWRRARSNGRWGYINEADEWVIKPEFEAVTPFRGNTASVFLDGQLMTINRSGEFVKN